MEVTLVTPPPAAADNKSYVEKAIRSLRQLGAVVMSATGLHGKDIVIDERIHYTGSLNWASPEPSVICCFWAASWPKKLENPRGFWNN